MLPNLPEEDKWKVPLFLKTTFILDFQSITSHLIFFWENTNTTTIAFVIAWIII